MLFERPCSPRGRHDVMIFAVRWLWLFVALAFLGCGSAPRARVAAAVDRGDLDAALDAYERFREVEGADADLLARVAGLTLEREASSDVPEVRRAALQQLALAGTGGTPILLRLSESEGVTPTRLGALEVLARHGRTEARLALRALADDRDPTVVRASIAGMDPELDQALLLSLARSNDAETRRAALDMLAQRAEVDAVSEVLAQAARVDADASVRAAAVRALGHAGASAVPMLTERLSDPEAMVRLAAVGALIQADDERARLALAPMLEVAPDASGIEAARLLIQRGEGPEGLAGVERARSFLRRALAASDPALRAQAGVAIASLPIASEPPLDALRTALDGESDPEVRLSLARALFRHDHGAARAALASLVTNGQGMPQVQAAALLAAEGDRTARDVLSRLIEDESAASISRRTAARALARDALAPDAVRRLLRDEDTLVRIYAAGGILAAAAAS